LSDTTHYYWQGTDLILHCQLQPSAANDEITGLYGSRLKIRITAPPVDGKANEHLVKWLSKLFKVPKSHIAILHGESGRQKTLLIRTPPQLPPAALVRRQGLQSFGT
jgi:uncharacterized protein